MSVSTSDDVRSPLCLPIWISRWTCYQSPPYLWWKQANWKANSMKIFESTFLSTKQEQVFGLTGKNCVKKAYVYANRQIVLLINKFICLFYQFNVFLIGLLSKLKSANKHLFSNFALFYFTNCQFFLLVSINAIMKFCFLNLCIGSKTDTECVSGSIALGNEIAKRDIAMSALLFQC